MQNAAVAHAETVPKFRLCAWFLKLVEDQPSSLLGIVLTASNGCSRRSTRRRGVSWVPISHPAASVSSVMPPRRPAIAASTLEA
jgi:hypothetical protein